MGTIRTVLRRLPLAVPGLLVAAILGSCGMPAPTNRPSPAPIIPSTSPASAAPSEASEAFSVTGDEAAAIATVERFVASINAGDLASATGLVADDADVSDCDYIRQIVVEVTGKTMVRQWIAERIADHDNLVVGQILSETPSFGGVVGVMFARRSNDTLARMGFTAGVVPSVIAKVVLTPDMARIRAFAFGPGGADPASVSRLCRPG